MIRIDGVSKQNGHQLLFIEASAALHRGEKVGLVGPNGAGKTTLFRMITGQEEPDEGQVSIDRGITIGYFSQDVGEMSGRSAVAEVMDGAGPVSEVAAELKELEAAMARHVATYVDEWAATLEDPDKLARFVSFVNAPDLPDPTISFEVEREQIVPARPGQAGPVPLGASIPVGAPAPATAVGR